MHFSWVVSAATTTGTSSAFRTVSQSAVSAPDMDRLIYDHALEQETPGRSLDNVRCRRPEGVPRFASPPRRVHSATAELRLRNERDARDCFASFHSRAFAHKRSLAR